MLAWIIIPFTVFSLIQSALITKVKIKAVKYLPVILTAGGLLFCLIAYFMGTGSASTSVIAENQYFAKIIAIPLAAGFAGCIAGRYLFSVRRDRN